MGKKSNGHRYFSTRCITADAYQHLASGGLLLQASGLDAETLLVSKVDELPAVILRYVLHILGYEKQCSVYP